MKKCPGCGAAVENDHVAHYPASPDAEPEPAAEPEPEPTAEPEPEPPEPVAPKRSAFDFSTQLFDDEE